MLQTVPNVNIEVGGSNLRWHHESSASGRLKGQAKLYETYRIPVRAALLLHHLTFLRQAMRAERTPPRRRRRVEKSDEPEGDE